MRGSPNEAPLSTPTANYCSVLVLQPGRRLRSLEAGRGRISASGSRWRGRSRSISTSKSSADRRIGRIDRSFCTSSGWRSPGSRGVSRCAAGGGSIQGRGPIVSDPFFIALTPVWHPCILSVWNCSSDARRRSSSSSRSVPLDGRSVRAGRRRLRRAWPAAWAVATVRCTGPPSLAESLRESSRRRRRTAAAPHPTRTTRRRPLGPSPFRCLQRWYPAPSTPWRRSLRSRHHSTPGARTRLSQSARFRSTFSSLSS
jgi:hypothetical protein